ncbi:MAG: aminopeptidase [Flavobacteriaceae bacterium]|nr:aminopeptidase [Flavobacteriaceae bacterium]
MGYLKYILSFFILSFPIYFFGQTNEIEINTSLNIEKHELYIEQKITFYNNSGINLDTIYFHNWPNAYKDKFTPLSKRLIESYDKSFYFSSEKNRGFTTIKNINSENNSIDYFTPKNFSDAIGIALPKSLEPQDSISIHFSYTVKIPLNRYTGYGRSKDNYYLRYWYLVPAVHQQKWMLQNNLDMDDLMVDFTNYKINFSIPHDYHLYSDLIENQTENNRKKVYQLYGNQRQDITISITKKTDYLVLKTPKITFKTDLIEADLATQTKKEVAQRALAFLDENLGNYPHQSILINQIEYDKYPVYGLNQLPKILGPFSEVFEWDIKLFKTLSKKYLENSFNYQKQTDYWLVDGLQTFLMMKYVDTYYPEIKAIGNISKIWGIKSFNISKLKFNDKYAYLFQLTTHANLDQALITSSDSLSNFNRKIINKYKAGLGLNYLDHFISDSIISKTIAEFYQSNSLQNISGREFLALLKTKTSKNIDWFENEYITSNKKIDYTLKKVEKQQDSIKITIQNNSNFTAPIRLYGLHQQNIMYQEWFENIDSTLTITIPKNGFDRLALNYEFQYPENNLRNNWKFINNRIIKRPIQLRFVKDVDNPYYNQLFFSPEFRYNYYDGLIIGLGFHNKTMLDKNFRYKILPSMGIKSKTLSGSFSTEYDFLPESSIFNVYKYRTGLVGSKFHYAPNLSYQTFIPYAIVEFNRKSLRDVGGSALLAKYVMIQREQPITQTVILDSENYNVFSLKYGYSNPNIIDELKYSANYQLSDHFSKISFLAQYRKLTDRHNRQFDIRLFAGAFLNNDTNTNFFDFSLGNATDYLFEYDYLGRSESSGIFSQQIIINEGGFKAKLPISTANQWITTLNTSVGIWRWIELYNDVGLVKNKNQSLYFAHENGIRLNFVNNYFELYFPIHSNNGWEISQPDYSTKMRFVFTTNLDLLFNFFRRGFF